MFERQTAQRAVAVAPNDAADLPGGPATCGLLVTVTGNLVIQTVTGVDITLTGLPVFTRVPIAASRVKSTGTTASVLALY